MSQHWYADGLPFQCTGCGNCCTGGSGFVWVTDDEVRAIADYLEKPVGEIRLLHTRPARGQVSLTEHLNGDCTFFDPHSRGCTVYPVRPMQCRTWPFWRSNIATPDDWERTCRDCPGSGVGPVHPHEEIERLVQLTNL
ncbi:MAG: YkgJ family cysteine cluster protein [Planctomycetaceae bacterium]